MNAALGNPLRWEMLKLMVQHGPLCASQLATMLKRDFDGVSKHLRVMRTAGVMSGQRDWDAPQDMVFLASWLGSLFMLKACEMPQHHDLRPAAGQAGTVCVG